MSRRKPHDPAAAARLAQEKREREAEIARLKAMGASVTLDRGGKLVSARRSNVFTLLLARASITPNHHDAAYRLAQDWAAWKGLDGRPDGRTEPVDGSAGCPEIITDRMLRAGRDVARALAMLIPPDRAVMEAFMVATVEEDRPMQWRGIMLRLGVPTGEVVIGGARCDYQVYTLRQALEALWWGYQEPRRTAA
jgi:hypothetical protein